MRYITKQQHKYTCGPTALANALKFKNIPCTYKEVLKYFPGHADHGIYFSQAINFLKKKNIDYKLMNPTFSKLEKELDKGRFVIIVFKWSGLDGEGHYASLLDSTKHFFKGLNYDIKRKKGIQRISKKSFAKHLRYSYQFYKNCSQGYPKAIVIYKK